MFYKEFLEVHLFISFNTPDLVTEILPCNALATLMSLKYLTIVLSDRM